MGIFSSRAPARPGEQRSTFIVPVATGQDSGYVADVTTAAGALQSVAYRAGVDLVASLVSELPLDVYRGKGSDRREVPRPAYLDDPAGDGNGLEDWVYQLLMTWLLRGNAYGHILDRSVRGLITQLTWFYPDDVRGTQDGDGRVQWLVNGRPIPSAELLHRRVNPVPGRVLGLSPIEFHATTLGLSVTTTRFGAQWFRDGANPSGLLTNEEVVLDQRQADTAKARFLAAVRGSREPAVLGKGWKYQPITIAPEESQFLETQEYSEAQCARIIGPGIAEVFGYDTGGSMTYANVVDRRVDVLVFTLSRWARRAERLLTSMLPKPQYARFNRDALLEATTKARYEAHEIALRNGFRVINEVRDDEDEAPVPWGDEPFTLKAAPTTPNGGNDGNAA